MARRGPQQLPAEQLSELIGSLIVLDPKSQEFRQKRLELALKFGRTERSVEMLYKAAREKYVAPGPSTTREQSGDADETPKVKSTPKRKAS